MNTFRSLISLAVKLVPILYQQNVLANRQNYLIFCDRLFNPALHQTAVAEIEIEITQNGSTQKRRFKDLK